ncbi:MAG: HAD-IA family hydrolase [Spirochaetia bacterium]|nr:HAD-IA family hydrolase [Spirochaetia bacterium]
MLKKLIIFDWDGTLMNSIDAIADSIIEAFNELSMGKITKDKAKSIIGLGLKRAFEVLAPDKSTAERDELLLSYKKFFLQKSEHGLPLYPGVENILRKFYNNGTLFAVATGKSRAGLERDFITTNTKTLFAASRTVDECEPKPHPHMIEDIIEELKIKRENVVMVGDTVFDLEMAKSAKVSSVACAYGAHPKEDLLKLNPQFMAHSSYELINYIEKFIHSGF